MAFAYYRADKVDGKLAPKFDAPVTEATLLNKLDMRRRYLEMYHHKDGNNQLGFVTAFYFNDQYYLVMSPKNEKHNHAVHKLLKAASQTHFKKCSTDDKEAVEMRYRGETATVKNVHGASVEAAFSLELAVEDQHYVVYTSDQLDVLPDPEDQQPKAAATPEASGDVADTQNKIDELVKKYASPEIKELTEEQKEQLEALLKKYATPK
eukprot:JP446813.1.p1 GENE.JP446813.1~~JP446813.1.p1  ORF type:complete len:208 (-),score=47.54 JP446813.1:185-808(-)